MIFRTFYFVGIFTCLLTSAYIIKPVNAETANAHKHISATSVSQYGPTTSVDTFWRISQKVRPNNSISIYQVMAAIFDANPHAFSGNNYNGLERGMMLTIPSADVMKQISRADAQIRAENNDKRLPNANPSQKIIKSTKPSIHGNSATTIIT